MLFHVTTCVVYNIITDGGWHVRLVFLKSMLQAIALFHVGILLLYVMCCVKHEENSITHSRFTLVASLMWHM